MQDLKQTRSGFRINAAVLPFAFLIASNPVHAIPLDIVVPAYFYPSFSGSAWDALTQAASSGVSITAIMNPGSGPGTSSNSDYSTAINGFRAAGGKVLGYVPSGYVGAQVNNTSTCQPASGTTYTVNDVVSCASRYQTFYSVDGIFVDEFGPPNSSVSNATTLSFYEQIYNGLVGINSAWQVVGNPGAAPIQGSLRVGNAGGANRLVTFENDGSQLGSSTSAAWTQTQDARAFINILYNVSASANLDALVAQIAARNVGGIYITDDTLPNPYDTLPAQWTNLIGAVQRFNTAQAVPTPASAGLIGLGLLSLVFAPLLNNSRRKKRQGA